jgi:hypothetical protein
MRLIHLACYSHPVSTWRFEQPGPDLGGYMTPVTKRLRLDQPALYRIEVQGQLDPHWSAHFDSMECAVEGAADDLSVTSLYGKVADQASLHGMLNRIRDLGLPLLTVRFIQPIEEDLSSEEQNHD